MVRETVIGLEIHAELMTQTKMFCACKNDPDETHPNINICPICMGHPGTLPVPNAEAIALTQRVGAALNCELADISKFDRKNYFYPDLPKGYQISQFDEPLCGTGSLTLQNGSTIGITRIHLEEDTGRSQHPEGKDYSSIDFNRAGRPLMELVTEPDLRTPEDVELFAQELQRILRYTNASHANMEKGEMRVEVNLSLQEEGLSAAGKLTGTKVEVKNLNSVRSARLSVVFEMNRQADLLNDGKKVMQETRGWHDTKQATISQRVKEDAHEYRYFPEPDIPPLKFSEADLDSSRRGLPELPAQRRERFAQEYGLNADEIQVFVDEKTLGEYYEAVVSEMGSWAEAEGRAEDMPAFAKLAANYLLTDLKGIMQEHGGVIEDTQITPENFAELLKMVAADAITSRVAKDVLLEMFSTGGDPSDIVEEKDLSQVSDTGELEVIARNIVRDNPAPVADFKKGKEAALQFLVGIMMAVTKGKANPQMAAEILKKVIGS